MKKHTYGVSGLFSPTMLKIVYYRDEIQKCEREIISRLLQNQDEMIRDRIIWPPETYHAHFLDLGIAVRELQIEIVKAIFGI